MSEPATYDLLLSTCFTIWLKALPEEHMSRVIAQGDTRPMAGNAQAMDDLRRQWLERIRPVLAELKIDPGEAPPPDPEARRRHSADFAWLHALAASETATVGLQVIGCASAVLFALGLIDRLSEVADVRHDEVGLALEEEALPKRVRIPRRKSPPTSQ